MGVGAQMTSGHALLRPQIVQADTAMDFGTPFSPIRFKILQAMSLVFLRLLARLGSRVRVLRGPESHPNSELGTRVGVVLGLYSPSSANLE